MGIEDKSKLDNYDPNVNMVNNSIKQAYEDCYKLSGSRFTEIKPEIFYLEDADADLALEGNFERIDYLIVRANKNARNVEQTGVNRPTVAARLIANYESLSDEEYHSAIMSLTNSKDRDVLLLVNNINYHNKLRIQLYRKISDILQGFKARFNRSSILEF